MEYKYTGIILNKRNVGEMDRIYSIYTLEGGKIRTLAKSVRKAQAKLAASLENITLADITIARTRGLGKITGSIVEQNYSALKTNCDALMETFIALGTFEKIVDFENPDKEVFELLRNYLCTVDEAAQNYVGELPASRSKRTEEKFFLLRLGFTFKLLDLLGHSMEVNSCVICQSPLTENFLSFSSSHGGVLCANCSEKNVGNTLPIKANTIKMMRLFLNNEIKNHGKIQASMEDCDGARLVLDDFLRWNL